MARDVSWTLHHSGFKSNCPYIIILCALILYFALCPCTDHLILLVCAANFCQRCIGCGVFLDWAFSMSTKQVSVMRHLCSCYFCIFMLLECYHTSFYWELGRWEFSLMKGLAFTDSTLFWSLVLYVTYNFVDSFLFDNIVYDFQFAEVWGFPRVSDQEKEAATAATTRGASKTYESYTSSSSSHTLATNSTTTSTSWSSSTWPQLGASIACKWRIQSAQ